MRGMRSVYAESTSLMIVSALVNVTTYVSCGDDVVDANEGYVVAVGHDG